MRNPFKAILKDLTKLHKSFKKLSIAMERDSIKALKKSAKQSKLSKADINKKVQELQTTWEQNRTEAAKESIDELASLFS